MTHEALAIDSTGLVRRFGRKTVLQGIDLALPRGAACAIVGRNGAGKSTLLRLVLGLLRPTAGRVRVLGLDPLHRGLELKRRTGTVMDRSEAFGWLSAREVLRLASGLHPAWSADECRRLLDRFELPLDTLARDLSRGQAAQLAFAIALAPRPELLVLDEPTSGLDPVARHLLLDEVRRAVETRGTSVLFTTHVMSDVEGAADDVVVLHEGGVLARGAPAVLGERYSRVSLVFEQPPPAHVVVPGARAQHRGVREIVATFAGPAPPPGDLARATGARDARLVPVSFDDVFLELQRDAKGEAS